MNPCCKEWKMKHDENLNQSCKHCLVWGVPAVRVISHDPNVSCQGKAKNLKVSILHIIVMHLPNPSKRWSALLFFPNLNLLCSNSGWLALFCAGSFSRDWKAINLIGWRLIWLISTLEYSCPRLVGISQGSLGTAMWSPLTAFEMRLGWDSCGIQMSSREGVFRRKNQWTLTAI